MFPNTPHTHFISIIDILCFVLPFCFGGAGVAFYELMCFTGVRFFFGSGVVVGFWDLFGGNTTDTLELDRARTELVDWDRRGGLLIVLDHWAEYQSCFHWVDRTLGFYIV